jgi:hypothetical protein
VFFAGLGFISRVTFPSPAFKFTKMDTIRENGKLKIPVKIEKHSRKTEITDAINLLLILCMAFGGTCSIQNMQSCYIFMLLIALLILIKYLKIGEE